MAPKPARTLTPATGAMSLPIPARIGSVEFGTLGAWMTVRCPRVRAANAQGRRTVGVRGCMWLIEPRRIGPLIRALRRDTDPLFRYAGLDLEG